LALGPVSTGAENLAPTGILSSNDDDDDDADDDAAAADDDDTLALEPVSGPRLLKLAV
jgi:hypothetical protein